MSVEAGLSEIAGEAEKAASVAKFQSGKDGPAHETSETSSDTPIVEKAEAAALELGPSIK